MTNPYEKEEHIHTHWVALDEEPHFGTYPCDCCDSPLAGDRWDAKKIGWSVPRNRVEEINCGTICVDCLQRNA